MTTRRRAFTALSILGAALTTVGLVNLGITLANTPGGRWSA